MGTQNQSDHQDTSGTVDEIDDPIKMAEESRKHFQGIAVLDGIVLETEIEVFPGVYLVPLPPSLGKKGAEIPRYVSDWASTVGIESFFHKTQLIIDSCEPSIVDSDRLLQALSLACNSAVQTAIFVSVRKDEEPFSRIPYAGPTMTHLPRDASKDSDIEEAKRLYKLLDEFSIDGRPKLDISINRWIKSHTERFPVDKAIDLGIAFESLYLSGIDTKTELSFRFSLHASWHLGKDKADRGMLIDEFKAIYALRSKAVHDGVVPDKIKVGKGEEPIAISEFIPRVQGLCQQSIIKIIEDGRFPEWKSLILG